MPFQSLSLAFKRLSRAPARQSQTGHNLSKPAARPSISVNHQISKHQSAALCCEGAPRPSHLDGADHTYDNFDPRTSNGHPVSSPILALTGDQVTNLRSNSPSKAPAHPLEVPARGVGPLAFPGLKPESTSASGPSKTHAVVQEAQATSSASAISRQNGAKTGASTGTRGSSRRRHAATSESRVGSATGPAVSAAVPRPSMAATQLLRGTRLMQAALLALVVSAAVGAASWPAMQAFSQTSSRGPSQPRAASAAAGIVAEESQPVGPGSSGAAVRVIALVPGASDSPLGAPWDEVMRHTAQRLTWTDPNFEMQVFLESSLSTPTGQAAFLEATASAQILLGASLADLAAASFLQQHAAKLPPSTLFFSSAAALQGLNRYDGSPERPAGPLQALLARFVSFSGPAKAARLSQTLNELWNRHSSDDLLFVLLVLINEYIRPVALVANTTKGFDLPSLQCMLTHCRQNILDCVNNPTCKSALDCLNGCSFNDQVCQYRCIVSYETPQLEQFSLCILQKHNCRSLSAEIPMRPDPAPMTTYRGQPMTHEAAEDMFVGWLGQQPYSWLIAGGKNPAYDYFPCQHQIFYRGKARGSMWYEPVFKVKTLDNREVWRRRKYRVRRGDVPGTFHLSVLDNGVTSKEFWRTLDCADDLSFCLFYYSGAASAAGLSYSGAVLGTKDGLWPEAHTARVAAALDRAGIKMWELSRADNSNCVDAPLQFTEALA